MSVDFAKMQELFLAAVEHHRPEEWDAYLDQACADDELRRQVKLLLKAHLEAGSVPGAAAQERGQTAAYQTAAEAPGSVIGRTSCSSKSARAAWGRSGWPSSPSRSSAWSR